MRPVRKPLNGSQLKLLSSAIKLTNEGPNPHGLCMHRSAAFVFDVPGAELVFGTFQPPPIAENPRDSTVPFIHCWAEYKGLVYAPTTIERFGGQLVGQQREGYYHVNEASDFHRLTRPELLRLDRQHGLKQALKRGGPCRSGASFGGTLMDAAGVDWVQDPAGGIVPRQRD